MTTIATPSPYTATQTQLREIAMSLFNVEGRVLSEVFDTALMTVVARRTWSDDGMTAYVLVPRWRIYEKDRFYGTLSWSSGVYTVYNAHNVYVAEFKGPRTPPPVDGATRAKNKACGLLRVPGAKK